MKRVFILSIVLFSFLSCVSLPAGKSYEKQTDDFIFQRGKTLKVVDQSGNEFFYRLLESDSTEDNSETLTEYMKYKYIKSGSKGWETDESSILYSIEKVKNDHHLTIESGTQDLTHFTWSYHSSDGIWIYPLDHIETYIEE